MKQLILLPLVALTAVACAPVEEQPEPVEEAAATTEADAAAIDQVRERFAAAFNAGDAGAVAGLYTDDAMRMPPNEPAVVGREAILSRFEAEFAEFAGQLANPAEEIHVAGDWAFLRGTYTMTLTPSAGGEPTQDTGKYLVVVQRQPDGTWLTKREIWNSDNPLPGEE